MAQEEIPEIDTKYGTRDQVEFARRMAEALLKGQQGIHPDAYKYPYAALGPSISHVFNALSGSQYRDIAGSQDKTLRERRMNPDFQNPAKNLGRRIQQPPASTSMRHDYSGGDPDATGAANADIDVASSSMSGGDDFVHQVRLIESGGNPNSRTGSYRGPFQFGKSEEQRYGINETNWNNDKIATDAFKKHMSWLYPQLEKKLGRAPTPGEMYLAHQQGVAGAPALLNSPDMPAWKAIRPYYKSDEMAKLAISGNIPKGNMLKKIPVEDVKAGDFSRLWTSRFQKFEEPSETVAGTTPKSDRMGLGGPKDGESAPNALQPGQLAPGGLLSAGKPEGELQPTAQPLGDRYAQSAFPSKPVPPGTNIQKLPPAPPLETDAQLRAKLMDTPGKDLNAVQEDYIKRKTEGASFETTIGKGNVTTGPDGEPIVTHTPSKVQTLTKDTVPIYPDIDDKGNPGFRLMLPGQGSKLFGTEKEALKGLQDWREFSRQESAKDTDLSTRTTDRAQRYELDQKNAETTHRIVKDRGRQLKLASAIANDPKFIAGSLQQRRELISKFFLTSGYQPPGGGADLSQAFVKLIAGNILEDIKGLGGLNLGQVRAKEMEVIDKMNANPEMSPGAMRAVVVLSEKMNKRVQEYQSMLLDYVDKHGKVDGGFYSQMRKHYDKEENDFMTDKEIREYRELFKGGPDEWKPAPGLPGVKRRKSE